MYSSINFDLADAAKQALLGQAWYMQEETTPMTLFSTKLSNDSKAQLAAKMLTFESSKPCHWNLSGSDQECKSYEIGKPMLELELSEQTTLCDLLGEQSFMIFDLLGLSLEWLKENPEKWENHQSYNEMKQYVTTVKVTNDVAERGVKLISDYAGILTAEDDMRGKLLQEVERCRRKYPSFRKSVLNS